MRDALMASGKLARADIFAHALRLRLQPSQFLSCLKTRKYQAAIDRDIADAVRLKLQGTPMFVDGRTSNHTLDGVVIVGAQPYEVFERAIERTLRQSSRAAGLTGGNVP